MARARNRNSTGPPESPVSSPSLPVTRPPDSSVSSANGNGTEFGRPPSPAIDPLAADQEKDVLMSQNDEAQLEVSDSESESESESESVSIETVDDEGSLAASAESAAAGAATGSESSENHQVPPGNGAAAAAAAKSYKERMKEQGLDPSLGVPQELADMMRAAAKAQGDISVASWYRLAWAHAVNAANLTHEVTHEDGTKVVEPWKFDVTRLEEKKARSSTKGLSAEEKAVHDQKKKQEQKEERQLVSELLAQHKAKLAAARSGAAKAPTLVSTGVDVETLPTEEA